MDDYKKILKSNLDVTREYYNKSIIKTEQQKMLEELLVNDSKFLGELEISDIACGGGTLSYHLSNISSKSNFTLIDYMEESIILSKELNQKNINRFTFNTGNIYNLDIDNDCFDFTFCWQTLSWLEEPREALMELIRITKRGGKIYLSSLFNLEHDVDIYSKVVDNTRESSLNDIYMSYNTYSEYTIRKWLEKKVKNFKIHEFKTNINFNYDGRGLGTFTKDCESKKIQISAGMLMHWGILEIEV